MRRFLVIIFVVIVSVPLLSQVPKAELFGGYSFSNGDKVYALDRLNLHGWNVSLAGNVNRWFAVVGDFSGHYGAPVVDVAVFCPAVIGGSCPPTEKATQHARNHTFLFGPRFTLRSTKASYFAHALFGGERLTTQTFGTNVIVIPEPPVFTQTGFAMAFGGGVDYTLVQRLGWRVQMDYLPARQYSHMFGNFRLSSGIVLRLGE